VSFIMTHRVTTLSTSRSPEHLEPPWLCSALGEKFS